MPFILTKDIWNTALLDMNCNPFDQANSNLIKLFSSRSLRFFGSSVHTYADPFLFVDAGILYLFLETKAIGEPGQIEAFQTQDLKRFESIGPLLAPEFHVSYPHVFRSSEGIHMLPETSGCNELALYTFREFPNTLEKDEVLLREELVDSSIIFADDLWWIFASTGDGLNIYYSNKLRGGYKPHPANPIKNYEGSWRGGGPILSWEGKLFRPVQNSGDTYGANLSFYEIINLSTSSYHEALVYPDIFDCKRRWQRRGGHHISTAMFKGSIIAAVDGKQGDLFMNRFLGPLSKLFR